MNNPEQQEPISETTTSISGLNEGRGHYTSDRRQFTVAEALEITAGARKAMQMEEYPARTYFTTNRNDHVIGVSCEVDTRGIHGEKLAQRKAAEVTQHITDICFRNRWELKLRVSGHSFIVPQPLETIIRELQERYDY